MIKTFEEQLKEWDLYFEGNRQVGHTTAVLEGVLNNKEAKIVCTHEQHRSMFPKEKTINFNSELRGLNYPVVFDNFTLHMLIKRSLYDRIDKKKVKDAIDKFIHHTACPEHNCEELIELKLELGLK